MNKETTKMVTSLLCSAGKNNWESKGKKSRNDLTSWHILHTQNKSVLQVPVVSSQPHDVE